MRNGQPRRGMNNQYYTLWSIDVIDTKVSIFRANMFHPMMTRCERGMRIIARA